MAPTLRSSTHARTAPQPEQIRFPRRRKLVRPRDSPPTLQKRQSTLTQLDYVSTPHSSARRPQTITASSDEDGDEYEETRLKKRRKTSKGSDKKPQARKRDPRQSTLTQKWDMSALREIQDSDEGDDDMLDMEDDDQSAGNGGAFEHEHFTPFEEHVSVSGSERSPLRLNGAVSSDVDKQSTRPTTADSSHPKTPNKLTKTCIPSSNTPASMLLSPHSAKSGHAQRSPLRERSTNISPSKCSPTLSTGNFGLGKLQDRLPDRESEAVPAAATWTATLAITPRRRIEKQPRKLVRTATVQDSEDEDMDLDDSPGSIKQLDIIPMRPLATMSNLGEPVTSTAGAQITPSRNQQPDSHIPAWKRTGIVPDSEESSLGLTVSSPVAECQDNAVMVDSISQPPLQEVDAEYSRLEESEGTPLQVEKSQSAVHDSPETSTIAPVSDRDPTPSPHPPSADSEVDEQEPNDLDVASTNLPTTADLDEATEQTQLPSDPLEAGIIEIQSDAEENDEDDDENYTADSEADYDLYEQHTYDPVQAALERDAARFGKTDTQLNAEHQYTQFVPFGLNDEEDEDDDDEPDLNIPKPADEEEEVEFVPSSQPHERTSKKAEGDIDDSGYVSQTSHSHLEERIPSSQPLHPPTTQPQHFSKSNPHLRPSQISTVVDDDGTQSQRSYWNSQAPVPPQSSSPFPVPPGWKSQQQQGETQISLTDFSLPPPPPLWTSSSIGRGGD